MSDRDDILNRLRCQQQLTAHPPTWQSRHAIDDLAGRFQEALTAAGGEVLRARSPEEALDLLAAVLQDLPARRVAVNDEEPLNGIDLNKRWPHIEWHVAGRSDDDLRAFCATADAGISGALAALAETGSVVVDSGPGRSRLVTLLPPVHIALVPTTCLTADLFTWTAGRGAPPPANLTMVTGPSKTADIEQVLTVGVHGPKRFVVVLYEG